MSASKMIFTGLNVTLNAMLSDVWKTVSNFTDVSWAGIEVLKSTGSGDVGCTRSCAVNGMVIDEKLVSIDHENHTFVVNIVGADDKAFGVFNDSYMACFALDEVSKGRTRVRWSGQMKIPTDGKWVVAEKFFEQFPVGFTQLLKKLEK